MRRLLKYLRLVSLTKSRTGCCSILTVCNDPLKWFLTVVFALSLATDSNLDVYRPRSALYGSSISLTCMMSLVMFESSFDVQSMHVQSMKAYNRDRLLTLRQLVSTEYLSMIERNVIDHAFKHRSYG